MRTLITFFVTVLISAPVVAQGWIEPLPGRRPSAVHKLRSSVSVTVTGRIALVEVEEWFENRGSGLGEGDYLYPLPGEAVFSNFSLFQGDQELRGETMEAGRARSIYEEIVRRKRDPALIELVGHGLIRARVFPINAGDTRKITLRYTQVLSRAGDALQFQYAAGGVSQMNVPMSEGFRAPLRGETQTPLSFRLVADSGDLFRDPFSPTHEVRVERDDDGRLTVRPVDELHGDFSVFLPFARDVVGITLATHNPAGENGYFMLTLSPGEVRGNILPRDVTAVVDVSGSMSGEKLAQAKAALRQLIASLGENDRFRLIAFSSRVHAHRNSWTRVNNAEIRNAREWIDDLGADGGTNIEGALTEAFRLDPDEGRIPMVIFLTDGLPSVGEDNPERLAALAEHDRDNSRVFAFGVGYDVNTYLLDRLSDAGRGATQYVGPGEDVEEAVGQLVTKVQRPVLADLVLARTPVEITEVYPERLPDLFAGEELVIFGRYVTPNRDLEGELVISGHRNTRTESYEADVEFAEHTNASDFIPRLWASRKLGYLTQSVRLHGPNEELIDEIRKTAMRYGLLSDYTSYLVQEPEEVIAPGDTRGTRRLSMGGVAASPAVATSNQQTSGAGAVMAAEQSRARREVRTAFDLDEADKKGLAGRAGGPNARHVAGRLFLEVDGVWTDMAHNDSLEVLEVEQFSDAYFKVLERLPELEGYLKEFGEVLVAGVEVSIKIGGGGESVLSPLRISRLTTAFRGR
jgi:Ca-activated chloride channel family protein